MNKRYIHVSTIDNKNIAIIEISLPPALIQKNAQSVIRQEIEKKLPTVLKDEYNVPVKIRHAEFSSLIPILSIFYVIVEAEEQDYELRVSLEETHLY